MHDQYGLAAHTTTRRQTPPAPKPTPTHTQVASGGTLESLRANATTRAMLERVTRCDDTLYADALRRLPPRAAFASHTNATCTADAWLATHPHA